MYGYIATAVAVVAGTALLVGLSYRDIANRRKKLSERDGMSIAEWHHLLPGIAPEEIAKALKAISKGLRVDASFLRPDDRFDNELALKGQFVIDDDTIEDIAESVHDQLHVPWDAKWCTVLDAVQGIAVSRRNPV